MLHGVGVIALCVEPCAMHININQLCPTWSFILDFCDLAQQPINAVSSQLLAAILLRIPV